MLCVEVFVVVFCFFGFFLSELFVSVLHYWVQGDAIFQHCPTAWVVFEADYCESWILQLCVNVEYMLAMKIVYGLEKGTRVCLIKNRY